MEPREHCDATSSPLARYEGASPGWPDATTATERLLAGFTYAEQQRLRYLRQLYERGKLTEFPRTPRD
jgi:hypothetical protein